MPFSRPYRPSYSRMLCLLVCLPALAACSSERLARNVYEGNQHRAAALQSPQERAGALPPRSHSDYERERERLRQPAP